MEAGVSPKRNGGSKGFNAQELHRVLLGFIHMAGRFLGEPSLHCKLSISLVLTRCSMWLLGSKEECFKMEKKKWQTS